MKMKLTRYQVLIYLFVFSLFFSGCSIFSAIFGGKPEITGIKKVLVSGISISDVDFLVTLEVTNDNNYSANILTSTYKIYLNDSFIGDGSTNNSQTVNNNSVSYIELPVRVNYLDLPSSAVNLVKVFISGQKLKYKVEGNVEVELDGITVTIPIGVEKELKANF
jgi:LEA14-like dessication related protein